jgi:hypothetical protein
MPSTTTLALFIRLQNVLTGPTDTIEPAGHHPAGHHPGARCRGDRGQATTEYALVLLAAALVGLMVVAWATAGGGTERIGRLFNSVVDAVIDRV